ncbi:hypothetical protein PFY12_14480 [Chryseobacterium camelliae]|uniref:Phage tail tape measure protein domain-containing protein n=1 Tax=Chryseobacterium camelliae TaxID=1265445 RepID=A0ABY7QMI5_9FLAO|nr:phage tail tape measure protein [Chryseobacterium camelliae]WBV60231.1 hypothetical protein PFY12_14480 [Chryseobacterium camelliae]
MAERINLAQFDIDTRLLEEKIAQNQTKIDLLNGEIRDTRKALKEYQDQAKLMAGIITEGNNAIEKANEELAQGIITQEQYNYIVGLTSDVIRESEVELARLIATEREQQLQLVSYRTDLRNVNDENRELNNLLRSGRTEVQGNEGAYREMSQQLTAARIEANNLGAEMRRLEREGQQNSEEYANVSSQWETASNQARNLHNELLELDRATGDNRRNVGNYTESIREAFGEIGVGFGQLMSGNIVEGLQTIRGSVGNVKTALSELWTAILANPLLALGAALTAVAVGLFQGTKAVFEYNNEVRKLNKEVEGLTNLTGIAVDRIREYATSLEKVFGRDFQDSVREINSLMKDFGLTSKEAFDLYNEGLAKGGTTNSEFGDSIREYGVLFAQNGYSAQEFLNLLNAGIDLDVYSDKLPDAIKEAGLSLNEQTKATRDALINAFGESFSDDLLKRVRNGSSTIKQAVDEIAVQAQKVGLNTQQIAQLNADVFKGAGEDAGGLLKIMEAVNLANDKDAQTLTKSQQATIKLVEANVALEDAKTKALKSDSVQAFSTAIDILTTNIQTGFYKVIEKLREGVEWFDNITGVSEVFTGVWNAGIEYLKEIWSNVETISNVFKDLTDALGLSNKGSESFLTTILKTLNPLNILKYGYQGLTAAIKLFTGVIEASRVNITTFALVAKNLFGQIVEISALIQTFNFDAALEKIKNFSISGELKKARQEAERIVALNKQAKKDNEETTKSDTNIKGNDKLTGASADAAAKAEKERQKLLDKQQKEQDRLKNQRESELDKATKQDLANAKERSNIAIQATQAELAEYIAMNAEKLKSDKRLTQERLNEIKNYIENVREKTQIANEQEKQQKLISLDEQIAAIKGNSQQELDQKKNLVAQKEVVEKEYATKELLINNEANEKRKELDKVFLDQKREMQDLSRALEFERQIAELEARGNTESEIQKVQLNQQTDQKLTNFLEENELKRQLDQENYDINAEIEAQRREIENQIALEQDEVKKQNLQNQLNSLVNIEQDASNKRKAIEKATQDAKLDAFASAFGSIKTLVGEGTALGKAAAIAETTINTYKAAQAAYAAGASLGGPLGAVMGPILAGLAVASGLKNVAKIAGIDAKPKAAKGMIAKGPSHANGGIDAITPNGMVEIEGGEAIINKKSTAMFYDVLSEINQLGGGVRFASGGYIGNISSLPTVQNNIKQTFDVGLMSEMISVAVMEGSIIGTQLGSQQGIVGLSENREIQRGANF